jgi:uncharacterized lipoprotein
MSAQEPAPAEVRDGETALIHTALPDSAARARVRAYFSSQDINFTVNPETGAITTDWYGERRCSVLFKCANRATVRVVVQGDSTQVRVQVFERRRRQSGLVSGDWNENSNSKGKETSELAAQLQGSFAR